MVIRASIYEEFSSAYLHHIPKPQAIPTKIIAFCVASWKWFVQLEFNVAPSIV